MRNAHEPINKTLQHCCRIEWSSDFIASIPLGMNALTKLDALTALDARLLTDTDAVARTHARGYVNQEQKK